MPCCYAVSRQCDVSGPSSSQQNFTMAVSERKKRFCAVGTFCYLVKGEIWCKNVSVCSQGVQSLNTFGFLFLDSCGNFTLFHKEQDILVGQDHILMKPSQLKLQLLFLLYLFFLLLFLFFFIFVVHGCCLLFIDFCLLHSVCNERLAHKGFVRTFTDINVFRNLLGVKPS